MIQLTINGKSHFCAPPLVNAAAGQLIA